MDGSNFSPQDRPLLIQSSLLSLSAWTTLPLLVSPPPHPQSLSPFQASHFHQAALEWEDQPMGSRAAGTFEMKDKKCPGKWGLHGWQGA